MRRQQIEDRKTDFDYFDRDAIGSKSDNRCCHCGQKKFYPYGATIDHFIPLSKGGTNSRENLIMLCYDCNQEKGNKIKELSYIPYLKTEYRAGLQKYYENYRDSFEYISRQRLLSADEYKIAVETYDKTRWHRNRQKKDVFIGKHYYLKSTDYEDFDRLVAYMVEYCEKYEISHSRELMEMQIALWLKFGAVYIMENLAGEIAYMTAILLQPSYGYDVFKEDIPFSLKLYIFSKYKTDNAVNMAYNMAIQIPRYICDEQHIMAIPVKVSICAKDPIWKKVLPCIVSSQSMYLNEANSMFMECAVRMMCTEPDRIKKTEREKMYAFIDKFKETDKRRQKIIQYLRDFDREISWAFYDILSPYELREVFKNDSELSESNEDLIKDYEKFQRIHNTKTNAFSFWSEADF